MCVWGGGGDKVNGLFLLQDFLTRICFLNISIPGVGQKAEEVALLSPRSGAHRFAEFDETTAISDQGFSKQDAGALEEGRVRTAHVTQLHFQVPKRSTCWNKYLSSTTRLFSSQGLIKPPKF